MSLIKNLISEPENKPRRKKNGKDDQEDEEEEKPRPIIKSVTDLQRLKLEKLMKNPDKPVIIPEAPKEKDYMQTVPSFVRNVMGSSAGAGSGEFHVYRHLRRKEYARQKTIQAKSIREQLDEEYQKKLEENRRKAEEKTAKKRAKRLKKKQRSKKPKVEKNNTASNVVDDKDEETSDDDEGEIAQDDNTVQTNEENVDSTGNESATSAENANGTQEQNIENNSNTNPVQDTTAETNTESREELPKDDIGAQETTSTSQNAEVIETNESTRTN